MKKNLKKLSLRAETIRALDHVQLADAAGGASVLIRCGVTRTCPSVCADSVCDACTTLPK